VSILSGRDRALIVAASEHYTWRIGEVIRARATDRGAGRGRRKHAGAHADGVEPAEGMQNVASEVEPEIHHFVRRAAHDVKVLPDPRELR
jgi:hypothetical protein